MCKPDTVGDERHPPIKVVTLAPVQLSMTYKL
jgi:hypothetical protein